MAGRLRLFIGLALVASVAEAAAKPETSTPPEKRFFSRWTPGENGWIRLFNGRSLAGWTGAPGNWRVKDGVLVGHGDRGIAFLLAKEADWADYTLALKMMLGTAGTAAVSHGTLAVDLTDRSIRLGYPQQGWKTLARKPKGLTRRKWYRVELDVRGTRAEVRINGARALVSGAHKPLAGGPAIEAVAGGVAFRDIRLKLHPSDPDYKAVALGEGYTRDPSKTVVVEPRKPRSLGRGDHVLFNGRTLDGWERSGHWAVRDGAMVARAGRGQVAAAFVRATAAHRDYIVKARCRILRRSDRVRQGEYFFLSFRQMRPDNFLCIRFPVEGIFEIGYYLGGKFHEVHHGVRKGDYNEWREIELTVRGTQIGLRVDGLSGLPTWTVRNFPQGPVGVGVTGGEAAFKDIRVRILR